MPKPVQRIPLEEAPSRRRILWMILSLAIAAGAFFAGFQALFRVEPGWREIPSEGSYARMISLRYDLGRNGGSASAEQKKLQRIFTLAVDQAGQALDVNRVFSDPCNLAWLNSHPNQEAEVSPLLYSALDALLSAGRWAYLGPLYEVNESLLASVTDAEAAQMDPRLGEDAAAFREAVLPFLLSPEHIRLERMDGHRVKLVISEEYLALGEEYGITRWIDFGWMRNAFAADYAAEALLEAGAGQGILTARMDVPVQSAQSSQSAPEEASGALYVRILCENEGLRLTMRNSRGELSEAICRVPAALISLNAAQAGRRYASGALRTPWLSAADGLDAPGPDALLAASREQGCGPLLLSLLPVLTEQKQEPTLSSEEEAAWLLRNDTVFRYGDSSLLEAAETPSEASR